MDQTASSSWKRAIAARFHWFVGAAFCVDAILVLGPPLLPPNPAGYVILPLRWVVMMVGIYSVLWAYREERIEFGLRHWLVTYLVFGFTGAAIINGVGALRS